MNVATLRPSAALILIATIGITVGLSAVASAQEMRIPGASSALFISLTPVHPGPGEPVRLTVTSPLYDLAESTITWSGNGVVIAQGEGVTEATVTTGKVGTETLITVSISGANGSASISTSIIPSSIDLLWEADSYTPPFFKGRALPSAGSRVRLMAIPHLSKPGGREIAASDLTYTWKKDGAVIKSASGKGKTSATLEGPLLFDSTLISVEALSADRSVSGAQSVRIENIEPILTLYQDQPLFGIAFHRALANTTAIHESEMSFFAAPYFAPVQKVSDARLSFEWEVNRTDVVPDRTRPNEITINADNSSGEAQIQLSVTHATNYFFSAANTWTVDFGGTGAGGVGDPFRN